MADITAEQARRVEHATPGTVAGKLGNRIPIAVGRHTMATNAETVTLSRVVATDVVVGSIEKQAGTTPLGVLILTVGAGQITINSDSAGDADGIVNFLVFRP